MRKSSSLWVAIGVLLFLLVALVVFSVYMLQLVRQTTDQALSPLMGANAQLRTQVSGFLHPTPTIIPDPVTIINEVRSLARLETIQYSIEKVITAETGQGSFGFLFGDKLLFVAHGTVIAGIDLGQLTSQDLRLDGKVLTVQLPEPEIFVATLDNDKSYVYDRQKGLLNSGVTDLETKARQVAEQEIAEAAISDGILSQAKLNAENYLTRLFKTLGYQEVIFIYPTPEDVP
ncbi:MAG: DUF4230 domain-containing protein [Anaerolineaceae bacterium]|jgi:hypothetical protein